MIEMLNVLCAFFILLDCLNSLRSWNITWTDSFLSFVSFYFFDKVYIWVGDVQYVGIATLLLVQIFNSFIFKNLCMFSSLDCLNQARMSHNNWVSFEERPNGFLEYHPELQGFQESVISHDNMQL